MRFNLTTMIENTMQSLSTWLLITLAGGYVWMIRRIFTNDRKIALMEAEILRRDAWYKEDSRHRDRQRDEDREVVKDIRRKVDVLYERGQA